MSAPSLDLLSREFDGAIFVIRQIARQLRRSEEIYHESALRLAEEYLRSVEARS